MNRIFALAVSALLLCAAPAWASTFQIYEDSLGSPGMTALFPNGPSLVADIDFDASSAEGGGLLFGASEIEIVPLGDAVLMAFVCQISGCTENIDYVFTAGGAGVGSILVSDPTDLFPNLMTGAFELGDITWDSLAPGSLELTGCNYTDANAVERTCDPFTLAQAVPEPGTGLLLGVALAALAFARRRS